MSELILPPAATDGIKFGKLSSKYDLISTEAVVNLMREEGFIVTATNSLKPRVRDPRMVRHFVRMRHEQPQASSSSSASHWSGAGTGV